MQKQSGVSLGKLEAVATNPSGRKMATKLTKKAAIVSALGQICGVAAPKVKTAVAKVKNVFEKQGTLVPALRAGFPFLNNRQRTELAAQIVKCADGGFGGGSFFGAPADKPAQPQPAPAPKPAPRALPRPTPGGVYFNPANRAKAPEPLAPTPPKPSRPIPTEAEKAEYMRNWLGGIEGPKALKLEEGDRAPSRVVMPPSMQARMSPSDLSFSSAAETESQRVDRALADWRKQQPNVRGLAYSRTPDQLKNVAKAPVAPSSQLLRDGQRPPRPSLAEQQALRGLAKENPAMEQGLGRPMPPGSRMPMPRPEGPVGGEFNPVESFAANFAPEDTQTPARGGPRIARGLGSEWDAWGAGGAAVPAQAAAVAPAVQKQVETGKAVPDMFGANALVEAAKSSPEQWFMGAPGVSVSAASPASAADPADPAYAAYAPPEPEDPAVAAYMPSETAVPAAQMPDATAGAGGARQAPARRTALQSEPYGLDGSAYDGAASLVAPQAQPDTGAMDPSFSSLLFQPTEPGWHNPTNSKNNALRDARDQSRAHVMQKIIRQADEAHKDLYRPKPIKLPDLSSLTAPITSSSLYQNLPTGLKENPLAYLSDAGANDRFVDKVERIRKLNRLHAENAKGSDAQRTALGSALMSGSATGATLPPALLQQYQNTVEDQRAVAKQMVPAIAGDVFHDLGAQLSAGGNPGALGGLLPTPTPHAVLAGSLFPKFVPGDRPVPTDANMLAYGNEFDYNRYRRGQPTTPVPQRAFASPRMTAPQGDAYGLGGEAFSPEASLVAPYGGVGIPPMPILPDKPAPLNRRDRALLGETPELGAYSTEAGTAGLPPEPAVPPQTATQPEAEPGITPYQIQAQPAYQSQAYGQPAYYPQPAYYQQPVQRRRLFRR